MLLSSFAIWSIISIIVTLHPREARYSAVSTPTRPPPITETLPNTISFLASTSHALATVGRSLPGTGIIALFAPVATITSSNEL